ncbi:hypothetical protein J6590_062849 [Homalodisca vitripennis]|nr:hypothetical protein J6590_062849 [Homalodisca vitripennis]
MRNTKMRYWRFPSLGIRQVDKVTSDLRLELEFYNISYRCHYGQAVFIRAHSNPNDLQPQSVVKFDTPPCYSYIVGATSLLATAVTTGRPRSSEHTAIRTTSNRNQSLSLITPVYSYIVEYFILATAVTTGGRVIEPQQSERPPTAISLKFDTPPFIVI